MLQSSDDGALGRIRQPSRLALWLRAHQALLNTAAIIGTVVLIGICAYRRVWHPYLSGGEALLALWPFYVVGIGSIGVRWLIRDTRLDERA